jgi:nitrile hydratase
MNGPQDLGGMMGFGPVTPEPNEPVFHAEWEKRALGIALAMGGARLWPGDTNRFSRESLPPAQYLSKSYYDIWMTALANMLTLKGLVSAEELAAGQALQLGKPLPKVLRADEVAATLARGSRYDRPAPGPARFAIGAAVRAKVINPTGHTRLPRYARGKHGIVEAVHGAHVYPDSNAHGLGENPQWLYTVRFTGREIWGEDSDPSLALSIEAFEPYLDPA